MRSPVRLTGEQVEKAVEVYGDTLFRICLMMLCREQDAEDAVQETFLRYITKSPVFSDESHEKAWLITVAQNICRNMLRFRSRHPTVNPDELYDYCQESDDIGKLEFIMSLPETYKTVLYLFYAERYQTDEIARMLHISPAAVRKRLQYARQALQKEYGISGKE